MAGRKKATTTGAKSRARLGWVAAFTFTAATWAFPGGDLWLVDAVKKGDAEAVSNLLRQKADVNAAQPDGATALAWAVYKDDLETAELLIAAGAKVNAANDYGATPLWLACTNGNAAMVEKLLRAGADPNAALQLGETPLMAAAEKSPEAVRLLLAHGADVNVKELVGGRTALMQAVKAKHPDIVQELIEQGADVRTRAKDDFTPLLVAAEVGDVKSVEILLAAGADVNEMAKGRTSALLLASAGSYEKLALFLLEKGADPNIADPDGYTPLHYAASRRSMLETVRALLAQGANPNVRLVKNPSRGDSHNVHIGVTPFFRAARALNVNAMRLLAAGGADVNQATTETTWIVGSSGRRLQMVANTTPLMMAAGGGRYGSYPEFTKEEEQNALEAVKLAVELGADVNAVTEYGQTALHAAAYLGANAIIQFLVERGAKVNVLDNLDQTPLSIAQRIHTVRLGNSFDMQPRRAYEDTISLLVQLGATPLTAFGVQVVEELSR
ncbi:MAG: ankyrin repeat domain-containing protein [Acidobacteria bacterium]|nr:ankyrin repeat domain-containing protein [Acidobacteriota bacterium]